MLHGLGNRGVFDGGTHQLAAYSAIVAAYPRRAKDGKVVGFRGTARKDNFFRLCNDQ
jgi:hypothetical protein